MNGTDDGRFAPDFNGVFTVHAGDDDKAFKTGSQQL